MNIQLMSDLHLEVHPHFRPEPAQSIIHISEPTRTLYISYAVLCLKKQNKDNLNRAKHISEITK